MDNIEILRAIQKQKPFIIWIDDKPYNKSKEIEDLIQKNIELEKELNSVKEIYYTQK